MPARRLPVRKTREVLRLKFELGLDNRQIARSCSIPHSSVANYLKRAEAAGLGWPLPPDLNDADLESKLFPMAPANPEIPLPDFASLHAQLLRHKHLTLDLLWQEYKQTYPEGYQYSWFCELYGRWARQLDIVLRQEYKAGEKMFVDHAGPTVSVVDPDTGMVQEASIFVAVLGASNYTFCEAVWKRDLPSWIGSHTRAVEFFQGVPTVTTPDNWKTGVKDPCYYDPDLNPTYRDWAAHYGTVIIPARVRKPRDKAKVETSVLIVERWILAALRHRRFFSLVELNGAIGELRVQLNQRKFRKLEATRERLFEEVDRPALKPLPMAPFEFAEWKTARVHPDYHVEVDRHYYSVPYPYVHEKVEVRFSEKTVEIFRKGQRIAAHVRSAIPGQHTTLKEHRPEKHQDLAWTSSWMVDKGREVGPATAEVLQRIMEDKKHPELGYRSCLGVLRLGKRYSNERLEAACRRAVTMNVCSYRSIKSILENSLDREPLTPVEIPVAHSEVHPNVRGSGYYRKEKEEVA
ncbi:MAG TPA: IS21 family transposase [Terriglobia bacterium]|nr:IS21 family transposase [Terriglobia bacterium]